MEKVNIKLLKTCSFFKASSLTESIIAMVIITSCISVSFLIYGRVISTDMNLSTLKAEQKIKELLLKTKKEKSFEDDYFSYTGYEISKRVQFLNTNSVYKVSFYVTSGTNNTIYDYIIEE